MKNLNGREAANYSEYMGASGKELEMETGAYIRVISLTCGSHY